MKYTIVSTQILIEWSDSPKLQICLHDMPTHLSMAFDEWLSEIEYERNIVAGLTTTKEG